MEERINGEKDWVKRIMTLQPSAPAASQQGDAADGASAAERHGFDDVAGMDELKQLITESLINVILHADYAKAYDIIPPSLLFYGPAGCGKTFFAEKTAEEVGINFIKVVPDDLASTLIHGTQKKISEIFKKAEKEAPTIIFFDEFDAMVPQRSIDEHNYQNGETNEFLCMLNNAAKRGIYVMAATNYPERIDRAVLRSGRIDEIIYVGMPDIAARESLFRLKLSQLPTDENINFQRLAEKSAGFNCSDITYIVKMASRKMFNASISEKGMPYKTITQDLLEETISQKTPSVSSRDLKNFERLQQEFSPKSQKHHNHIGFV